MLDLAAADYTGSPGAARGVWKPRAGTTGGWWTLTDRDARVPVPDVDLDRGHLNKGVRRVYGEHSCRNARKNLCPGVLKATYPDKANEIRFNAEEKAFEFRGGAVLGITQTASVSHRSCQHTRTGLAAVVLF